ncbi:unnamed protein product [Cuscuta epithymum]|uniref:peptidyl-tRNA hydrolase n=1 Tax=Cuscuta epithymum TaxID=186058 RepID=A0AAV0G8K2_9ASTE|nr:unnamed protein product [Cuscuta epithymum]CAH9143903.1 unnamed protein product [Cuscuta epithymum]
MNLAVAASTSTALLLFCRRRLFFPSRLKALILSSYSSRLNCMPTSTSAEGPLSESKLEKRNPNSQPWLIVGLGNPGKRFSGTRHNVGFEMVDTIAEAEGISMSSVSFKALFGKGFIGEVPVILAKPQTFMNLSGESVGAIVSYYKIPLKQVLVLRLLPKGGHGGHNGMRSVIDRLKGSRDFPRLRIGIGRPPGRMDPASYVLRPFNREERAELDFTLQNGLEAVRILVLGDFNRSATFVNSAKPLQQFK